MKKRFKVELGHFLNQYGTDWRSVPDFWDTLETAVMGGRHRPPTHAEKMRFNDVRMELIREFLSLQK
tara:strand:- start:1002 stop:1202 length:201 start_codon:yes stop_codon:yes gene_type:complete